MPNVCNQLPNPNCGGSTSDVNYDYQTVTGGQGNQTQNDHATVCGGQGNQAKGTGSHAEGINCQAAGNNGSHAEGYGAIASGESSHAEGYNTYATGPRSHVEGEESKAVGENSHAEGQDCRAVGRNSHAEGEDTIAWGLRSHAEGQFCQAIDEGAHAHGNFSFAAGTNSTAMGNRALASRTTQVAISSGGFSGIPGEIQCSWLALKGEITENTTENTRPDAYLKNADGTDGWGQANDGKAYSIRVKVVVAAIVSNGGTYGPPPDNLYVVNDRLVATLSRTAVVRVKNGAITVAARGPLETVGERGTTNWDLLIDGEVVRFRLPRTTDPPGQPPVNCRISGMIEFQEVRFKDFVPTEVPGLSCWLKPDPSWVDGAPLPGGAGQQAAWLDSSPAGIHFAQSVAANTPTTFTNLPGIMNGQSGVRFDGANDSLVQLSGNLASLIKNDGSQYTIFVVAGWKTSGTNFADPRLNDMILADTNGKVGIGFQGDGLLVDAFSYVDDGAPVLSAARMAALTGTAQLHTTWLTPGTKAYLRASTNGGNGDLAAGLQETGQVAAPLTGTVRLGVNYNASRFTPLDLYEVIVFNRVLNVGERMSIVAYLAEKFGLSTN